MVEFMVDDNDRSGQSDDAWSAERYRNHAGFVPALGRDVVALLAPKPGERILDLGCGDGGLTQTLIEAGAEVVGIDASARMVAAARYRGIEARRLDATRLDYDGEFDAVFSNAALHWICDADAVIAGVNRALKPGGRFVGEFGGLGNVASVVVALAAVMDRLGVDPDTVPSWYFPSTAAYRDRLESHGFEVTEITIFPRPTVLPGGMEDWLDTLAAPVLTRLPEAKRAAVRDGVVALLRPVLCDESGIWTADYVRLRFAATRAR